MCLFFFKPRWLAKLSEASNEPEPTDSTNGGKDSSTHAYGSLVNTESPIQTCHTETVLV